MTQELDVRIREALEEKALDVEVPADLAERTMAAARASARPTWSERMRGRRDARRVRTPIVRYPRWMYAGATAAALVLIFGVGFLATDRLTNPSKTRVERTLGSRVTPTGPQSDADVGIVNSGESSVDATNRGGSADRIISNTSEDVGVTPQVNAAPRKAMKFPPRIVRKAWVEVEVRSFERAWDGANDVAGRFGGFVTSSNTEEVKDRISRGTFTMRVPSDRLDEALDDLRGLGTLAKMKTSGSDVAPQIVDLDARIKAAETEELTLLDLLRRTSSLGETVQIRNRLDSQRQEIETLKAQKAYYADQVDYSTVKATIFEKGAKPQDPSADNGIIGDSWRMAVNVFKIVVAGLLVVLGGFIPLAAIALAIWFLVRLARRRSA